MARRLCRESRVMARGGGKKKKEKKRKKKDKGKEEIHENMQKNSTIFRSRKVVKNAHVYPPGKGDTRNLELRGGGGRIPQKVPNPSNFLLSFFRFYHYSIRYHPKLLRIQDRVIVKVDIDGFVTMNRELMMNKTSLNDGKGWTDSCSAKTRTRPIVCTF